MPRRKNTVEETGVMNPEEFIKAVDFIVKEKGISPDIVFEGMELALATAYKKNFDSKTNVRVDINRETGEIKVISYYVVVDEIDEGDITYDEEGNEVDVPPAINLDAQILLEDAKAIDPDAKVGDTIEKEVTPKDFGRVAAGTAKQVLTQKIREAEKNSIIDEFQDKQDEMLVGSLAMEDQRNYYVELGRTRGILPKSEIIPGEQLKMGSSIKVYVTKVESNTKGPLILLSRKHYGFVKRLFEREIPEFADGTLVVNPLPITFTWVNENEESEFAYEYDGNLHHVIAIPQTINDDVFEKGEDNCYINNVDNNDKDKDDDNIIEKNN